MVFSVMCIEIFRIFFFWNDLELLNAQIIRELRFEIERLWPSSEHPWAATKGLPGVDDMELDGTAALSSRMINLAAPRSPLASSFDVADGGRGHRSARPQWQSWSSYSSQILGHFFRKKNAEWLHSKNSYICHFVPLEPLTHLPLHPRK